MQTIRKIPFVFCLCAIFSFVACISNTTSKIDELNSVRPAKDRPVMISSMRGDSCTISDCIFLVASQKGINKDGKPCLLVKHPAATSWTPLEGEIKYFKYEEGFEYQIMCKETKYDNNYKPTEYELTGVDSKEKKTSDLRTEEQKGIFEDTSWDITHFEEVEINRGYFRVNDENIAMSLGCNSIVGTKIKVNEINKSLRFVFERAGMTEMACDDRLMMEQEGRLFNVLSKIDNYEAAPKTLILKSGDTVLMRLKR